MSKDVLPTPESPITITFTSRLIVVSENVTKENCTTGGAGGDAQAHRTRKRKTKKRPSKGVSRSVKKQLNEAAVLSK